MAGKRGATSELNYDNWNQEEEPEEKGIFRKASEDALKNRVIKAARRRNPIRSEDSEKKSAFVGFTGFSSKPPSSDFSFLKEIAKPDSSPKTNGIDKQDTSKPSDVNIFSNPTKSIFGATATISTSNTTVPSSSTSATKRSEKYCSKLKGLNESVSEWIRTKVEENPLISLQPIFKDYEKYLNEIEKEDLSSPNVSNVEVTKPVPTFNFNPLADKNTKAIADSTSEKSPAKKGETFKFGATATTGNFSGSTFTFGSSNNSIGGTKSFSSLSTLSTTPSPPNTTLSFSSVNSSAGATTFPISTGFTFGGAAKSDLDDKPKEVEENPENDEEEPPKVEFKPVVEKDHLYTVRCKVFVKKGESFGDRGVGNLYLKPIKDSEKKQLIVRADTNLGNLLLNFILSESIPTKRMGKKDVMLVAIPTPDAQPPPTPILVRVKSPEEADNLLAVLEKHKK